MKSDHVISIQEYISNLDGVEAKFKKEIQIEKGSAISIWNSDYEQMLNQGKFKEDLRVKGQNFNLIKLLKSQGGGANLFLKQFVMSSPFDIW